MRSLASRRLVPPLACAALFFGAVGTTAAAIGESTDRPAGSSIAAPLPDADATLKQVDALGTTGGVVASVTKLLTDTLKADNGRLSTEAAAKHETAIKAAITTMWSGMENASAAGPSATATPGANGGQATPTDVITDEVAKVEAAATELLTAATALDPEEVPGILKQAVTTLVELLKAALGNLPLPLPSVPPSTSTTS